MNEAQDVEDNAEVQYEEDWDSDKSD